jgi:hypothetical protein
VREAAAQPRWVIEGVYGWLAAVAVPRATALIWLDMPWALCREGLLARGQRRGGTEADFAELMVWAEAYWTRQNSNSFARHLRLFESFPGAKRRLRDRLETQRLLAELAQGWLANRPFPRDAAPLGQPILLRGSYGSPGRPHRPLSTKTTRSRICWSQYAG